LQVFEIDPEWASYVRQHVHDPRLHIALTNVLEVNFEVTLGDRKPWVLLANLPYQITFPILFLVLQNKHLFNEGVVMVQEEVAHKIVAQHGRGYNPTSLFLQYHFDWRLMEKIEPGAFSPPPKVYSRLLYFKPKTDAKPIPDEERFWAFLKFCFRSPRQTLRNNLKTTHLPLERLSAEQLSLRAQQLNLDEFLAMWQQLVA
jgi:16S rRNA (adenine1518-N6/adenine1519-N6)-dimethyltransferase